MNCQKESSAGNVIVLFLAFFIFAVAAHGQSPTPTPGDETISVKSDLIQTNVSVVDKNNRFVENLKREQFELRVDGKSVPLKFFEQIVSIQANENPPARMDAQKQNSATANPNLRGRNIIFFIDDLHLSLDSLGRTRSTIAHFIENEMMPRDEVLIVSASGQIGFLQQFTDNKAVLRAALARLKPVPNVARDTEQPPMTEFVALRIANGDREAAFFYVEKILQGFNVKALRGMNQNAAFEMVKNRANDIVSGTVSVSEASLGLIENLMRIDRQDERCSASSFHHRVSFSI